MLVQKRRTENREKQVNRKYRTNTRTTQKALGLHGSGALLSMALYSWPRVCGTVVLMSKAFGELLARLHNHARDVMFAYSSG